MIIMTLNPDATIDEVKVAYYKYTNAESKPFIDLRHACIHTSDENLSHWLGIYNMMIEKSIKGWLAPAEIAQQLALAGCIVVLHYSLNIVDDAIIL